MQIDGPGTWSTLHGCSLRMTLEEFSKFVVTLTDSIRCPKCQKHLRSYIEKHPPSDYEGIYDESKKYNIGNFKWTWILHNVVNTFLEKPLVDFHDALAMWTQPPSCETGCSEG